MTNQSPSQRPADPDALPSGAEPDNDRTRSSGEQRTRTLSVNIDEDLLRRLRVIAVLKDTSLSALIETYLASQVRRDLKKVVARLGD
jgi:hypothetical protein